MVPIWKWSRILWEIAIKSRLLILRSVPVWSGPTPDQANYLQAYTPPCFFFFCFFLVCKCWLLQHESRQPWWEKDRSGSAEETKDLPGVFVRCEGRLWSRCLIRSVSPLWFFFLSLSRSPPWKKRKTRLFSFFPPFWTSAADIRAALCLVAFVCVLNLLCTC